MADVIDGNLHVRGTLTANAITIPAGTILNAAVADGAALEATKLIHQFTVTYWLPDGADVASTGGDGVPIYTCRAAGGATIVAMEACMPDPPSGGDDTVDVDLLDASDGVAAATVLTAALQFADGDNDYEIKTASIADADLADGDTLLIKCTKAGSSGTAGQGLCVTVTIREASA